MASLFNLFSREPELDEVINDEYEEIQNNPDYLRDNPAPKGGYFDMGVGINAIVNNRQSRRNALRANYAFAYRSKETPFPVTATQQESWELIKQLAGKAIQTDDPDLREDIEYAVYNAWGNHVKKYLSQDLMEYYRKEAFGLNGNTGEKRKVPYMSNFNFLNQGEERLQGDGKRNLIEKTITPDWYDVLTTKRMSRLGSYTTALSGQVLNYDMEAEGRMFTPDNPNILSIQDMAYLKYDPIHMLAFNSQLFARTLDKDELKNLDTGGAFIQTVAPITVEGFAEFGTGGFVVSIPARLGLGARLINAFNKTRAGKFFKNSPVLQNISQQAAGSIPIRYTAAAVTDEEYTARQATIEIGIETIFVGGFTKILSRFNKGSGSMLGEELETKTKKVMKNILDGSPDKINSITLDDLKAFRMARKVAQDELSGKAGQVNDSQTYGFLVDFLKQTDEIAAILDAAEQSSTTLVKMLKDSNAEDIVTYVRDNEWLLSFVQDKANVVKNLRINFKELDIDDVPNLRTRWNKTVNKYNEVDTPLQKSFIEFMENGQKNGWSPNSISAEELIKAANKILESPRAKPENRVIIRNNMGGFARINDKKLAKLIKDIPTMKDGKKKLAAITAVRSALAQEISRTITVLKGLQSKGKITPEELENFLLNDNRLAKLQEHFNNFLSIQEFSGQRLFSNSVKAKDVSPTIKGGVAQRTMKEVEKASDYLKRITGSFSSLIKIKGLKFDVDGNLIGTASENTKKINDALYEMDKIASSLQGERAKFRFNSNLNFKFLTSESNAKINNSLDQAGLVLTRAPWAWLRSTFLGKIFNRLVEPIYANTKAFVDRKNALYSAFIRGDDRGIKNALKANQVSQGFVTTLRRLFNKGYHQEMLLQMEKRGRISGITHLFQRLSVIPQHRYYAEGTTNPFLFENILTESSQEAILKAKFPGAKQSINDWAKAVRERVNLKLGRAIDSVEDVPAPEFMKAMVLEILNYEKKILGSGEPLEKIWNDVSELSQLIERVIPAINDGIVESTYIPQYAAEHTVRLYSKLKQAGGLPLSEKTTTELLARTDDFIQESLKRDLKTQDIADFYDYINKTIPGTDNKISFLQELEIAIKGSEEGIATLTLKTELDSPNRNFMIRFLGKLDKLARQAPVLGEAFVGAFIRTGVNIEAATQSLIFPFQDVGRHLFMPKVTGKVASDYDISTTWAKLIGAAELGAYLIALKNDNAIYYDENTQRSYLRNGDKEVDLQAVSPKLAGIIDMYGRVTYELETIEELKLTLSPDSPTYKELTGLQEQITKAGQGYVQQLLYRNFRTQYDMNMTMSQFKESPGRLFNPKNFAAGIAFSDFTDAVIQLIETSEENVGDPDNTVQLFSQYWDDADNWSQNLATYRKIAENKFGYPKVLADRNPDGTTIKGGQTILSGKYKYIPDERWAEEMVNLNISRKDLKIPVDKKLQIDNIKDASGQSIYRPVGREWYIAVAEQGVKGYTIGGDKYTYSSYMNELLNSDEYISIMFPAKKRELFKKQHNGYWKQIKEIVKNEQPKLYFETHEKVILSELNSQFEITKKYDEKPKAKQLSDIIAVAEAMGVGVTYNRETQERSTDKTTITNVLQSIGVNFNE